MWTSPPKRCPRVFGYGEGYQTTSCGPSHRIVKHRQTRSATQPLAPLREGDVVRIQNSSWATKSQVLKQSPYPQSYHVITQEGRCVQRNRKHLLPSREALQPDFVPNGSNTEPSSSTAEQHVKQIAPNNDLTTKGTSSGPTPSPRRSLR
ncbi:hypothetical protein MRX96_011879 [Rhipicephalus microplus]